MVFYRYFVNMILSEVPMKTAESDLMLVYAAICLAVLSVVLAAVLCGIRLRTVRIYNWNGDRYCYLGRAGVRRNGGGFKVQMKERMADLSYTTLYQICPSRHFVRKNKYADMLLSAGKARCLLHVDECMRQSIYYR